MQTTARAIINRSLRLLKVIAANESGAAADLDTGLLALNDMLDSWGISRNNVFSTVIETFPLVLNQATYTIGVAGNFNTINPISMEESSFVRYQSVDYALKKIDEDQYSQIPYKLNGGIPYCFWFNPGVTTSTISFYPVPQSSQTLELHSIKPFTAFAGLDTNYVLPPGYKEALTFNLAVGIATEFETEAPKTVILKAMNLKKAMKRQNVVVPTMDISFIPAPILADPFDWRYQ